MLPASNRAFEYYGAVVSCVAVVVVCVTRSDAQSATESPVHAGTVANSTNASPIYGVTIPDGYRDWQVIAVNQLLFAGKGNQLRAQLGNDIAIKAFKDRKLPFPDGAIIAAIHWTRVPSEDNNKVLDVPFPDTGHVSTTSTRD
jgi:hypothetical protein